MAVISDHDSCNQKLLYLSCWNVNGLSYNSIFGEKLTNPDFVCCLDRNDILILTKTWTKAQLSLHGFELITTHAKKYKSKKHGRSSGSVAIGFKTVLKKGIKPILFHSDYIWCKLDKYFFHLEKDIFLHVCAIYIPPRNSPYFNIDVFNDLENDIAKFSNEGYVILSGDLNARTGSALDHIEEDASVHIPGDMPILKHNLKKRNNYDNQINDHGKTLLDICKTCDLRILNGRTKGDSFGKITYHSPIGISTVDYVIVSHNFMNLVENFIVKQPTIFSDHSQITCWFRISQTVLSPVNSKPQIKTHNLPKQFIWEQNSNEKFLNTILLDEFQSRLLLFEKSNFIPDSNGIDIATGRFSSILNDISLRSLRLSCSNKTPTKRSSKKWFDKECAYLRKKLTSL